MTAALESVYQRGYGIYEAHLPSFCICTHIPFSFDFGYFNVSGNFLFCLRITNSGNKHCVILLLSCLTGVEPQWSFRVFWQSISLTLQDTTYFLNLLHIFFSLRFRVIVLILGAGDLSLVRLLCKSRAQLYTLEILYIVDWLNNLLLFICFPLSSNIHSARFWGQHAHAACPFDYDYY